MPKESGLYYAWIKSLSPEERRKFPKEEASFRLQFENRTQAQGIQTHETNGRESFLRFAEDYYHEQDALRKEAEQQQQQLKRKRAASKARAAIFGSEGLQRFQNRTVLSNKLWLLKRDNDKISRPRPARLRAKNARKILNSDLHHELPPLLIDGKPLEGSSSYDPFPYSARRKRHRRQV